MGTIRVRRGTVVLLLLLLLLALLLVLLLTGCVQPRRLAGTSPRGDESTLIEICEGVVRLFEREAEAVWPGYSLARQPFLVYVPDEWALLFNVDKPIDGFGACPADWQDLGSDVLYHDGRLDDLAGQLAFDLELGNVTTVAVGFPERFWKSFDHPEVRAFSEIVHEAFHQYQRGAFGEIPWAREERYPISDLDNGALAWLEMRVLQDVLEAVAVGEPERCRAGVEEFVAVRRHRWERGDPFVGEYEQGKELSEGTAKYVELKSVALAGFFPDSSMPELLLRETRERMGERCLRPEDIPRNRIYAVAAAQGFLLDYFGIEWKERAEEAGPAFTYTALLQSHLGPTEEQLDALVQRAKRRYAYGSILSCTTEAAEEYEQAYTRELRHFEAQGGVRVELVASSSGLSRSRVSREKKWLMDNGRSLLCSRFEVYTLRGAGWKLELHEAGVLEHNDWDRRRKEIVLYDPGVDSVSLDGGPVILPLPGTREFQRLELSGDHFVLESTKPGRLEATGDTLRLLLDPD